MFRLLFCEYIVFFHTHQNVAVAFKTDAIGTLRRVEGSGKNLLTVIDKDLCAETVQNQPQFDFSPAALHLALPIVDKIPVEAGMGAAQAQYGSGGIVGHKGIVLATLGKFQAESVITVAIGGFYGDSHIQNFLIDIRSQVDEHAVGAVGSNVIAAEANTLESIGQHFAGDTDIDLLSQGVGHGVPLDGNAGIFGQLVQDDVGVVTSAIRSTKFTLAGDGEGERLTAGFRNATSGYMDELKIYECALTAEEIGDYYKKTQVPEIEFFEIWLQNILTDDYTRTQFHGGPYQFWMNEPHAPVYYNGKYHLFFQQNMSGAYWRNICWGHLVSGDVIIESLYVATMGSIFD